jgi:membrane-associated phospholipid phosphatase
MPSLLELDREVFLFINSRMSTHLLDVVMPIATDLHKHYQFWLVVVIGILFSIFRPAAGSSEERNLKHRNRAKAWATGLLILGLSMGLSDFIAYRAVKVWVQRDRPEAAGVPVILRTNSHSGWSFPSNHSANNFAMARTVQILAPTWAIPAYVFAAFIAYSRVYVGVHYPLDVTAGAFIGLLCATFVSFVLERGRERFARRFRSDGYSSREKTTDPSS